MPIGLDGAKTMATVGFAFSGQTSSRISRREISILHHALLRGRRREFLPQDLREHGRKHGEVLHRRGPPGNGSATFDGMHLGTH